MASLPQMQASILDRLSDDILQHILDLAMARDSPCYIDDPRPGLDRNTEINPETYMPRVLLKSSTGATDPHFTGCKGGTPLHHRTLQPVHRRDWIAINSTSRRIRAFGKISFFSIKTFAMHQELPARLQRHDPNAIIGMVPDDQALALSYIRDIVIVNPRQSSPTTFLALPRILAAFPCLHRCTLLFGWHCDHRQGKEDNAEWITAAFALGGPVPLKMQEHMTGNGMPKGFRLDEAMGRGSDWQAHRIFMEAHIYPTLRVKSELLRAKKEKEMSAASQVVPQI
ncbi:hypothetical protein LAWI1_G007512 [Lachnellula willkommii]|uniref:Uncharacterized protein n=1 Tax=Lachnellula willkommii TaxID=215461 RepID=A0A559M7I0_9HELO|nr:hypothetical protein LAWI1_G007512 [Lachnellula willkommii]